MKKKFIYIIFILSVLFFIGCENKEAKINNPQIKGENSLIVENVSTELPDNGGNESMPESEIVIPESLDLEAPFVSQAPNNNWDELHNEACEEASVLSVISYLEKQNLSREEQDKEIQKMVSFQMNYFGGHYDLPAAKVKEFVEKYYENKYQVQLINNPSVDDIKKELAKGNPVIIPASGRTIANPHYTGLGPVYHMLVIRGYDNKKNFITNDVGTHHTGDGYKFKINVIYEAIHDMPRWLQKKADLDADPNMIFSGDKIILTIKKS